MFGRFTLGLRRYLDTPLTPEMCPSLVANSLCRREENFLDLLRRAVFDYPASPYRPLFRHAGVSHADMEQLVRREGIEPALEKLYDAGVRVKLDEFKGRTPLVQASLERPVHEGEFDNPLLLREFELATSGSTGPRRPLVIDFDLLVHESACYFVLFQAHRALGRPAAMWRPVPPGSAGLKAALRLAKLGWPLERWFSPNRASWADGLWKSAALTKAAVWLGRTRAVAIPKPEFVPLDQPGIVARWAAGKVRAGFPALVTLPVSAAVRVCRAATEIGLPLEGTVLRVGSEPLTEARARVMTAAGASLIATWSIAECGVVGGSCGRPSAVDDLHLYDTKVALIQRPAPRPDGGVAPAFHLTTVHPATPKLMLNVETGDCGVMETRTCGCPLEELGLRRHVHTIRSYEKFTAAGMHVLGADMMRLVDEVLPARYGGAPSDYQVVEDQRGPASRVLILASPRIGPLDERAVREAVLDYIASQGTAERMMAGYWKAGGTVSVERREPFCTSTGKVPPIRVLNSGEATG